MFHLNRCGGVCFNRSLDRLDEDRLNNSATSLNQNILIEVLQK